MYGVIVYILNTYALLNINGVNSFFVFVIEAITISMYKNMCIKLNDRYRVLFP